MVAFQIYRKAKILESSMEIAYEQYSKGYVVGTGMLVHAPGIAYFMDVRLLVGPIH
jgi:hypothetical protein